VQSPVSPVQSPTQPPAPLSPQPSLLPLAQSPVQSPLVRVPVQSPLVHSPVKPSTPPPTPLSPPPLLQTSVQPLVPVQMPSVQSPVQSSTSPPPVAQLPVSPVAQLPVSPVAQLAPDPLAQFSVAVRFSGQRNIKPGVPIPSGSTSAPAGSSDEPIQHSAAPMPPPAFSAGGSEGPVVRGARSAACLPWRVRGARSAITATCSLRAFIAALLLRLRLALPRLVLRLPHCHGTQPILSRLASAGRFPGL
ncbi:vegetative cell wall protein gp1-like, partial [Oreochromis aureus]|uniref:vegetative cell wall protein gp1-like n=1 Tax=Oreochromis aureus TaxID=47969 RepID=UPI001954D044